MTWEWVVLILGVLAIFGFISYGAGIISLRREEQENNAEIQRSREHR